MDFTAMSISKMGLELFLGICIKLLCDNGRIHWRDFVNDFMFWVPGFQQLPGDGLTRSIVAATPTRAEVDEALPSALAAK